MATAGRPMDEGQRRRAVEHLHIAEHAARAFHGRTLDREERMGVAYLALCLAACAWRPGDRGTFAAYAYGACRREILKAFRRARVRFHWDLADRMLAEAEAEDEEYDARRAAALDWVEGQLRTMAPRRRRVIDAYLRGLSPGEIARELGEDRTRVRGVLGGILRTLKGRATREGLKPCG